MLAESPAELPVPVLASKQGAVLVSKTQISLTGSGNGIEMWNEWTSNMEAFLRKMLSGMLEFRSGERTFGREGAEALETTTYGGRNL